jgi:DNA-binding beta-propeller fold protein YncE
MAIALRGDSVAWRKHVGGYPDSFGVSPDGLLLYVPLRTQGALRVVNAATGEEKHRIMTEHWQPYRDYPYVGAGPHNTWISPDGSRVYLEVLGRPYIYVFDAHGRRLLGKIGPFSKGVRPFTVSADERHVYATIDGLRGFEVANLRPGHWGSERVRQVAARVPPERFHSIQAPSPDKMPHGTPSHGIAISPDQKEVWVVDGVYGYFHVFSLRSAMPTQVASISLTDESGGWAHPGWISFSIDGRFAYTDGGIVVDARTRRIVGRIPVSDKLLEVDFVGDSVAAVGRR